MNKSFVYLSAFLFSIGVFAFLINFSKDVDANGIQQRVLQTNASYATELFVASPQHNSTQSTNVVQYNARYSWINCGNESSSGAIKVYEHIAGGKVSSAGNMGEWRLLDQKTFSLGDICRGCDDRTPMTLTITGTFTLPSLQACRATTLWTVGENYGALGNNKIYDFTWINRSGCATPTPTPTATPTPSISPTPKITPTPSPTPSSSVTPSPTPTSIQLTCIDGDRTFTITTTNNNINCNNINNVVNVTVDNSSNNSSSNSSSSSTGDVNVTQTNKQVVKKVVSKKVVVATVAPTPVPTIAPVPVTAKTGPEGVAVVAGLVILGGAGLAYVLRKQFTN